MLRVRACYKAKHDMPILYSRYIASATLRAIIMKKTLIALSCSALGVTALPVAAASSFHLVVPLTARTVASAPVESIAVSLAGATLPKAMANQSYSESLHQYLSVTGDAAFDAAAARWILAEGALPAGLALDEITGTVAGVPASKTAASTIFTVRASYKGETGQAAYSIDVGDIELTLATAALPDGVQGAQYSVDLRSKLSISGDADYDGGGVTWSIASGSLPQGLVLSTDGVISGVPSAANTGLPFTIRAAYKTKSGEQAYAVVVGAITVKLASATLPTGVVGKAYSGFDLKPQLTVAGDAAYAGDGSGVVWALASGSLPPGLALDASTGVISGTPTARGTGPVQVLATYKDKTATQSYTIPLSDSIKQFTGYRAWSDGTLAASCLEYLQGKAGYNYDGATGDGIYRIDPDGAGAIAPMNVQCDMTTDGGGWTLVFNHNGLAAASGLLSPGTACDPTTGVSTCFGPAYHTVPFTNGFRIDGAFNQAITSPDKIQVQYSTNSIATMNGRTAYQLFRGDLGNNVITNAPFAARFLNNGESVAGHDIKATLSNGYKAIFRDTNNSASVLHYIASDSGTGAWNNGCGTAMVSPAACETTNHWPTHFKFWLR